jgi:hypothetical protein
MISQHYATVDFMPRWLCKEVHVIVYIAEVGDTEMKGDMIWAYNSISRSVPQLLQDSTPISPRDERDGSYIDADDRRDGYSGETVARPAEGRDRPTRQKSTTEHNIIFYMYLFKCLNCFSENLMTSTVQHLFALYFTGFTLPVMLCRVFWVYREWAI